MPGDLQTKTEPINIVLFGPSGVRKRQAGESLASVCRHQLPACKVQYLDVADFLSVSTHLLLDYTPKEQQDEVTQAIARLAVSLKRANLNIIGLHASHLSYGIPVFPCSAEAVSVLGPHLFITLLDDVYACRARLAGDGYPYSCYLLLNWRVMECGVADHLASACKVENIYLAAKHPRMTAYRLLFEPRMPRLYSASQITAVRDDPQLRQEIEQHRRRLHQQFVVFDPLTTDDRVLVNSLPKEPRGTSITIGTEARWPCDLSDLGEDYACLVAENGSLFPFQIDVREAIELSTPLERRSFRSPIDAQITQRDFRYIDQSDVVSAYRPRLNGHESSGVAAEKRYAAGTGKRPVVEYSTQDDLDKFYHETESRPFSTPLLGPACTTPDQFYGKLAEIAKRESARRYGQRRRSYARFEAFRDAFARPRK